MLSIKSSSNNNSWRALSSDNLHRNPAIKSHSVVISGAPSGQSVDGSQGEQSLVSDILMVLTTSPPNTVSINTNDKQSQQRITLLNKINTATNVLQFFTHYTTSATSPQQLSGSGRSHIDVFECGFNAQCVLLGCSIQHNMIDYKHVQSGGYHVFSALLNHDSRDRQFRQYQLDLLQGSPRSVNSSHNLHQLTGLLSSSSSNNAAIALDLPASTVIDLLAVILHFNTLQFISSSDLTGDICTLDHTSQVHITAISTLLGLSENTLITMLTTRTAMVVKGEAITKGLGVQQAVSLVGAIVSVIYRRVMEYLLEQINGQLQLQFSLLESSMGDFSVASTVSIVDMRSSYALPSASDQTGDFNSLMHNYCAEYLHHTCQVHIQHYERHEYERQGVTRINNSATGGACCESLLNIVFSALDDVCRMSASQAQRHVNRFAVRHFDNSQSVVYDTQGFVSHNTAYDLPLDVLEVLVSSSNCILNTLNTVKYGPVSAVGTATSSTDTTPVRNTTGTLSRPSSSNNMTLSNTLLRPPSFNLLSPPNISSNSSVTSETSS
eukprot:gene34190-42155_t